MARMTSGDMMKGHDAPINPITGTHRPLAPGEVDAGPWNVEGDAGIPDGTNDDGDPMTGGDCY